MSSIQKFTQLVLLAVLVIAFQSCQKGAGKTDMALKSLPTNSSVVSTFDVPALMEKAKFEKVKQMEFYQFLIDQSREESDLIAAVLQNPDDSGIDLDKNAYFTLELDQNNPEEFYGAFVFNLTDDAAFAELVSSLSKGDLQKRGDFKFLPIDFNTAVAWNGQVGLLAAGDGIGEDEAVLESFFQEKEDGDLSQNENLQQFLSEEHDISTWLTSNAIAQNPNAKFVLSMANIKADALNDNFIHSYADFEDGKVVSRVNYFFQEALIGDVNLMFKDEVKTDFSKYIPAKNLISYLSVGLNFRGFDEALAKRPQNRAFVDFYLKGFGLSIKQLVNTFDGDMALVTYTGNVNNRQEALFVTKIKDEEELKKMLTKAEDAKLLTAISDNKYSVSTGLSKMLGQFGAGMVPVSTESQLLLKDDMAILTGNASLLDLIESGDFSGTGDLPENVNDLVKNPVGFFLDFDGLKRAGINYSRLDELETSTNKKTGEFLMTLKDQSENSLFQIFQMINDEFIKDREQKQPVSEEKI